MKMRRIAVLGGILLVLLTLALFPVLDAMGLFGRSAEDLGSARARVRVTELSQGAIQYFIESGNRWYPAQTDPSRIGSGEGQLTGAQVLAIELFFIGTSREDVPDTRYCSCNERALMDADGRYPVLSDLWAEGPMPVLYYPARRGYEDMEQYVYEDNRAHTHGHEGGDFREFIRDARSHEPIPHNAGSFLLIAPGIDRMYFTKDDITNW